MNKPPMGCEAQAGLKMPIHDHHLAGDLDPQSRSDSLSFGMLIKISTVNHKKVAVHL